MPDLSDLKRQHDRLPHATLNLESTGAILDGSHDNTGAFQGAVNSLPNGGTITIPAGVLVLSSTINFQNRANLIIEGAGSGPGGASGTFAATTIRWNGAASSVVFDLRGTSHCTFRDFGMDPNGITGLTAMRMDGNPSFNACQFNLFQNLRFGTFTSGFSTCMQFGVTADTQVSEMTLIHCRYYGYTTYAVEINSAQSTDNLFLGCEFQADNDAGTEIGLRITRGGFYAYGCTFLANNIDIDIAALDLPSILSGFEAERSNKFLNITTIGNSLTVDTGYISVTGANKGTDAISIGALGAAQLNFRNFTIDSNMNFNISTSNSSTIVCEQVNILGTGSFTGQKPTWTSGASGVTAYRQIATAGRGLVPIVAVTSQRTETAADTNVLTYSPPATASIYRVHIVITVSAATAATLGWTMTWRDSTGTSQAPANLDLVKNGVAAPALTFLAAAGDTYMGDVVIDTDTAQQNIVVKLTFSGSSFAAAVSAVIEQLV